MNSEEIIINLRILESLEKNQKLVSRGSYLNIEPVSIVPESIRRWNRQDNRNEALKKINLIVNSAIEIIKSSNSNKNKNCLDIEKYLKKALFGIQNLKETYATCNQTCARIDVIIDKIKTSLNITNKNYEVDSQNYDIENQKYDVDSQKYDVDSQNYVVSKVENNLRSSMIEFED